MNNLVKYEFTTRYGSTDCIRSLKNIAQSIANKDTRLRLEVDTTNDQYCVVHDSNPNLGLMFCKNSSSTTMMACHPACKKSTGTWTTITDDSGWWIGIKDDYYSSLTMNQPDAGHEWVMLVADEGMFLRRIGIVSSEGPINRNYNIVCQFAMMPLVPRLASSGSHSGIACRYYRYPGLTQETQSTIYLGYTDGCSVYKAYPLVAGGGGFFPNNVAVAAPVIMYNTKLNVYGSYADHSSMYSIYVANVEMTEQGTCMEVKVDGQKFVQAFGDFFFRYSDAAATDGGT